MISLDATLINTVVPRSQYFCWHEHVFPSFEESLVLPLWLKTVKCFLGCCLSRPRIEWPPLLNTSSWYLLKVFPARRRTNSENKRQRDEVDGAWGGGDMFRSHSLLFILILLPWASFLSPFTPCSLSYSPTLCSLTPHFLSTLFVPLLSNPSLHTRLSLHPFGLTALLIMPVIGVTHTFSVCLDQIKNIVSILPTRPLLAELNGLCSVLSAAN